MAIFRKTDALPFTHFPAPGYGGGERKGKTGRVQRALAHANWLI